MSRKHGRGEDTNDLIVEEGTGKRRKLDSLFEKLNLHTPSYIVNAPIQDFGIGGDDSENWNFYISQRLNVEYNEQLCSQYAVIKWYDYRYLVIYRFQRWVLSMFNRFIRQYNKKNSTKIAPVLSYDKMFMLIDGQLTQEQVLNIILEENRLLLHKLTLKFLKAQDKKKQDQIELLESIKYDYWDTLRIDEDFEMKQALEEPAAMDVSDSDQMDTDPDP
jgi:hypothetical protein